MPQALINTVKNNTQFKLSSLHDLSINTSYKKIPFYFVHLKKKKSQKHLFCKGDSCTKK